MMNDLISKILTWLKSLSIPLRIVILLSVCAILFCLTLVSCGSVTRTVVTTSGNDSVQLETTVLKRDSTSINVNVNPNISFPNSNNSN